MKRILTAVALLGSICAASDVYKLDSVRRVDSDLYRSGRLLVVTRYCYHYAYGEDAILKYEGPGEYSGSKIIWDDGTSCEVKKLLRR
jgi:hypothetical protein